MYLAYNNSWLVSGNSALAWYVPSALPAFTMRLLYTPGVVPISSTNGMSFTRVSTEPNIWDMTYLTNSWWNPFDTARCSEGIHVIAVLEANTTGVTSMPDLFYTTHNLRSVSWFDTSSVTDMYAMFRGCRYIKEVPLFDTHNVTNMDEMFRECESLETVPLFDTSNVGTRPLIPDSMSEMFYGCTHLTSVPLFDTSNVQSMNNMFSGCVNLTEIPLFNTSRVKNLGGMCYNCRSIRSVPLLDTSSCLWMPGIFQNCINVETGAYNLYVQASTQSRVPDDYQDAFASCGINSVSGAAELSQIPSSWGGTAP